LWCLEAHAQEQTVPDRVIVPHGSGEYELRLHPATVAVLYFPDELQAVSVSNQESFLVRATGNALSIRPKGDVSIGPRASVRVVTPTMRVSLRLHVVEHIERATLQRTFLRQTAEPPRKVDEVPIYKRFSVQLGGAAGRAWMRDRAGNELLGDPLVVGGLTARVGFRGSRFHAYEATIHVGQSEIVPGPCVPAGELMAETQRAVSLAGAELGASVRLPFRLTPMLRVGAGAQRRDVLARIVAPDGQVFDGAAPPTFFDLTGRLAVGVEYRAYHAWSIALDINAVLGWPHDEDGQFTAVEGGFHVRWN
jgi:hypothetical protein